MAKRPEAKLSKARDSGAMKEMVREAGAGDKVLHDVSRLSNGHLKMVGVKHDARAGMLIPADLKEAWHDEAKAHGYTSDTDCFEDVMLRWIRDNGKVWKLDESGGDD